MADVEKLKQKISSMNMTMVGVAKKSGILRETLYNRFSSGGDFKGSEIESLSKVLKLTKKERDDIFFASERVIKRNKCDLRKEKGE